MLPMKCQQLQLTTAVFSDLAFSSVLMCFSSLLDIVYWETFSLHYIYSRLHVIPDSSTFQAFLFIRKSTVHLSQDQSARGSIETILYLGQCPPSIQVCISHLCLVALQSALSTYCWILRSVFTLSFSITQIKMFNSWCTLSPRIANCLLTLHGLSFRITAMT